VLPAGGEVIVQAEERGWLGIFAVFILIFSSLSDILYPEN
jgi:hypothetical protein